MKKYSPKDLVAKGDLVLHNGVTYAALKPSMGRVPSDDGQYWAIYTDSMPTFKLSKGQNTTDAPKYDSKAVYKLNDTVKVGEVLYRAKRASQGKFPEDYAPYWEVLWESDKPISIPRDETPDKPIVIPKEADPIKPKAVSIVVIEEHGHDGKDGKDGINGTNGINGLDGISGPAGVDGKDGVGLEFKWDDTKLGIKREDQTEFQFTELKGEIGRALIGGGSSNKFRLSSADLVGNTLISTAKPAAAELKTLKAGSNVTITSDSTSITIASSGGGGGGSGHTIQNEGTPLTTRTNLNFVGSVISATDDSVNDATVITVDVSAYSPTASFAAVAFSGVYADLTGTPSIPSQYTDELAQDAAASLIQNGTGISWSYNDGANTLTPTISLTPFSTTNLAEGTNLYYTSARFDTAFAAKSTTNLTEGSNLYFTDERAQDAVGSMVDSTIVYTDGTPLLSRAALTGDITASAGSNATTLATVNANVGSFTYGSFTVNAKGLITAASSGAAPEVPLTFSTGLTRTVNTVTVNTTQNIAKLSNLTTNGFVKTGGGDGTLSIDTATYLTTASAASTYQPLDSTLTSLAAYNTNGILTQTSADTFTGRTITGTASRLTVTNGDGVAGNPTLDISSSYVGQATITTLGTITTGTWTGTTIAVANGGTGQTTYTNGQLLIGNTTGNTLTKATLTAPAAGITITNGTGSITFALADDLLALEGMSGTGLVARTASNTYAQRTITAPAAGITVSNGDGVSGNPTLALANDLSAAEGLSGTGSIHRTATDTWTTRTLTAGNSNCTITNGDGVSGNPTIRVNEVMIIAASDETTAITAGTAKVTFRMPYAFTLTAVRASLTTAATTGGPFTVDINESGTTILSTKLTIDDTEKTSTTAATAAVISDSSLADDAEITIDVDTAGLTPAGLKVYLIGYRTN